MRDKPWIFRTYAGHSTAADSNALYRKNLAKGQTGLSVAFDLPTQTGYDSDHVLAKGEVGKVGVPVCHLGDMRALFEGIPLATMNTSMTINATAAWLMALYIAVADEQGAARSSLQGTIQNDIIKEYLSRGTYVFPPAPSMRLIDQPHGGRRWKNVSAARQILFDDVVLDCALQATTGSALLVGDRDIKRHQPRCRGVNGHRRVHRRERNTLEQGPHIAEVAHRHADLADLTFGQHVIGIVTGLRRQIEGDGQAGLSFGQVLAIERVGVRGRRMAGVGTKNPR